MGVSNQASDARRAAWLRAAFRFTRAHNFVLATYFNFPHPYWQIDDNTLAGAALRAGIDEGSPVVSHTAAAALPRAEVNRRNITQGDAPDLKEYRILDAFVREEICASGEGLAVIIDAGRLPAGMLPHARIDRVVGRRLFPVEDRAGLNQIRRGDDGREIVESAWLKLKRLPDRRIALIWERSKSGGPEPGDYEIRYYLSRSRSSSDIQPRDLSAIQRLHCEENGRR